MKRNMERYETQVQNRVNMDKKMPNVLVGQYVRVRKPGLVEKRAPCWSDPLRIVNVLGGAVKPEDGRVRNLRYVSLCKRVSVHNGHACGMQIDVSGYMMGDDACPIIEPNSRVGTQSRALDLLSAARSAEVGKARQTEAEAVIAHRGRGLCMTYLRGLWLQNMTQGEQTKA
ncbi:hypothetical protein NDU88_001388 [Pleurodeles waltl]|uniref:Uncharacterized protein n=1 Tax=Pleurodeles waltl TaxID=8319 RepID=A0AAV7PCE4_PLEWA|nr:hypothetical protein NDU88_001388 [Pleurodeles waltl]